MKIYEYNTSGLDFNNKLIFDCAIGAGESTFYWAKAIHDNGGTSRIVGFDRDLTADDIEIIKDNLKQYSKYVEIKCANITDLHAYKSNSVDYINCDDTLVFLAATIGNIEAALKEFYRLLKPNGLLIINSEIPVLWGNDTYIQNQYRRWNLAKAIFSLKGAIWALEPDKKSIIKILEDIGFLIDKEKEFDSKKQKNPIPCIEEWASIMKSEVKELNISQKLKESLFDEIKEIEHNVREQGMACPGYYSLQCSKR